MREAQTSKTAAAERGAGGVLVVGLAHSGKTEVRRILETGRGMFATREARHWKELASDAAPAGREPRDLAARHHAEAKRRGATSWCVQVNGLEPVLDRVLVELPHVKVVHTVRDPRQGIGVSSHAGFPGRRGWDLSLWMRSAATAVDSTDCHPDRYLVVRWEDLVAVPSRMAAELGGFVGLDVDVPERWDLDQKRIGSGVGEAVASRTVGGLIQRLGYPVSPRDDERRIGVADALDLMAFGLGTWRADRVRGTT